MKRCPKCNRTFPDENQKFCTFDGGLLITPAGFDPNLTIRATAADVELRTTSSPSQTPPSGREEASTSRDLPNLDETIAASAPTAVFPRNTAPTGNPTSMDLPAPPSPSLGAFPPSPGPSAALRPPLPEAAPRKKSKLPWIIAAVVLLLILGGVGLAAVFFVAIKPRLEQFSQRRVDTDTAPTKTTEQTNVNTAPETKPSEETAPKSDTFVPPADATKFVNSKDHLDGKLAEHYVDFSFYYPGSWQSDPKAGVAGASNFARVFKIVKDGTEVQTPESAAVSWYNSNGTYESDVSIFPDRVEALSAQLARGLPNYRKVSEGPTQVNASKAYDFHFSGVSKEADKDLPYWGRAIFIPPGADGDKSGVTIIMLVTGQSSDVTSEEDVGVKGELPLILESFRFGRKD